MPKPVPIAIARLNKLADQQLVDSLDLRSLQIRMKRLWTILYVILALDLIVTVTIGIYLLEHAYGV